MQALTLAAGFVLLAAGGEFLVRSAVELANRFGVPPLLVGFTIVAAATSAPELVVGVSAALGGTPSIVLGNVTGANIANLGLGLGAMALVRPFRAHRDALSRDILMLVLAIAGFLLFGMTVGFTWWAATGALIALVVHLRRSYRWQSASAAAEVPEELRACFGEDTSCWPVPRSLLVLMISVAALVVGAEWLLDSAVSLARAWGVQDVVIGTTVVALGTTLPETATAVVAAARGRSSVALGNLVGSCLFNLLGVLGATSLITPFAPDRTFVALSGVAMMVFVLVSAPLLSGRVRASRATGGLLVGGYAAYVLLASGVAFGG